jgi:hypothetical protein
MILASVWRMRLFTPSELRVEKTLMLNILFLNLIPSLEAQPARLDADDTNGNLI